MFDLDGAAPAGSELAHLHISLVAQKPSGALRSVAFVVVAERGWNRIYAYHVMPAAGGFDVQRQTFIDTDLEETSVVAHIDYSTYQ